MRAQERALIRRFGEVNDAYPTADKVLLLSSLEGLSAELRRDARPLFGVRLAVPATFFDTAFSWETSRSSPTAASRLADKGRERRSRLIAQPFVELNTGDEGDFALSRLRDRLSARGRGEPAIHIVAGPAGVGKTALFESLFFELYEDFRGKKNRRIPASRPVPLVPEYLESSDARTIGSVLGAFLRTDFVRPLDARGFSWMLTHGWALWMLDGLDEVIGADRTFVETILEIITDPQASSTPRILICVRDSLLSTNDDLRDLTESYGDTVRTYRLERWQEPSIRSFAEIHLRERGDDFVRMLRERPDLGRLAELPFYCDLLAELFLEGEIRRQYSEEDLLDHALTAMLDREYKKGTVTRKLVDEADIRAFVESLAVEDLERGLAGVSTEITRELAEAIVPSDLPDLDLERLTVNLTQLPLFAAASRATIRFAQEIMEQYLLGVALARSFDRHPETFRRRLGYRPLPADWITLRVVAGHVSADGQQRKLAGLTQESQGRPTEFEPPWVQ